MNRTRFAGRCPDCNEVIREAGGVRVCICREWPFDSVEEGTPGRRSRPPATSSLREELRARADGMIRTAADQTEVASGRPDGDAELRRGHVQSRPGQLDQTLGRDVAAQNVDVHVARQAKRDMGQVTARQCHRKRRLDRLRVKREL